MANSKFQGRHKNPCSRLIIHMCPSYLGSVRVSIRFRWAGKYYAMFLIKLVATFWTIKSKYLCFLGKASAIFRKEKKKKGSKSKLNSWIQTNSWRGVFPLPLPTILYEQICKGAIWHFLVWNIIISSFSLSYTAITLMYFSHRDITLGTTLS